MQLESMYQEIILDHYRNPHRKGLRTPFDAEVHHVNPTCGDEVTLRVKCALLGWMAFKDALVRAAAGDAGGETVHGGDADENALRAQGRAGE